MKTYIHVNQHKIRANKKHGTNEPVITVKQGKKNTYCHSVEVMVIRYGGMRNQSILLFDMVETITNTILVVQELVIETESEVRIGE